MALCYFPISILSIPNVHFHIDSVWSLCVRFCGSVTVKRVVITMTMTKMNRKWMQKNSIWPSSFVKILRFWCQILLHWNQCMIKQSKKRMREGVWDSLDCLSTLQSNIAIGLFNQFCTLFLSFSLSLSLYLYGVIVSLALHCCGCINRIWVNCKKLVSSHHVVFRLKLLQWGGVSVYSLSLTDDDEQFAVKQ